MTIQSKEEKKALLKQWKEAESTQYLLSKVEVEELFSYLENQLESASCDDTLRHTMQWLQDHFPQGKIDDILSEIEEMGGYCDCEVRMNCYEDYDLA